MKKKWKREDITPHVLRELLTLDQETGKLYWRYRGPEWFSDTVYKNGRIRYAESFAKTWNRTNCGDEAFTSTWGGKYPEYRGSVLGYEMSKIPVVYKIYTGRTHEGVVATLDGDRLNTRPENLFDSTRSISAARLSNKHQESTTGYTGVSISNALAERGDKKIYQAQCAGPIGVFNTPIEAARAYDQSAFKRWGRHARLNFPEDYGLDRNEDSAPEGYFET